MSVDERVAAIAARQENVITLSQLRAAGLGHAALVHRIETGRIRRLHRGVYLLGAAAPTHAARLRAAVLACGPRALISHRSSAGLWGVLKDDERDMHVTVVGRNPRAQAGIVVHRSKTLTRADVRTRWGIPLTSPARTICDLAATEPTNVLERTLSEARVLGLVKDRDLRRAIDRMPTRKGTRILRNLLDDGPAISRSEAERLLSELVRGAGLPRPLTNVQLHGYNVDFLWPNQRLVVEVDGYTFHGHRGAFERDRRRDQALIAAGYRVIRVTWRQLTDEPLLVVATIAQALSLAA